MCAIAIQNMLRAEHQRGMEADPRAEQAAPGIAGEEDAQQAAQPGPQPRLPFAQAEQLEGERVHPVLQRRFFEILDARSGAA